MFYDLSSVKTDVYNISYKKRRDKAILKEPTPSPLHNTNKVMETTFVYIVQLFYNYYEGSDCGRLVVCLRASMRKATGSPPPRPMS